MKKKIGFLGLLSLAILPFASCTQTVNDANISDEGVSSTLVANYNASFTNETGTLLDEDMKVNNKKHYEIYLSADKEASLFVVRNDITSYVKDKKDKFQKSNAKAMQFDHAKVSKSADLLSEMLDEVDDNLFDEESIINDYLTVDFEIDLEDGSLSPSLSGKFLYDFYKENKDSNIYFDIVYLPLNVYKYDKKNQPVLRRYVFAPIYCEYRTEDKSQITKDGLVETKISSALAEKEVEFSNLKKHYIKID